jgi:UDP-N-acetylmuramate dehydrogenase
MEIHKNQSLKSFNTFGIEAQAKYMAFVRNTEELIAICEDKLFKQENRLILGGGSNMLLTKDFNGLVVKMDIPGIRIVQENENSCLLESGAGVNWHSFVQYCVENELGGIENLSLIPGNVGAAPMQNIGAYGVEIKDTFHSLSAFDIENNCFKEFTNKECEFDYRSSIFKTRLKNKCIIVSVRFLLNKKPQFNTTYGAIEQELEKMQITSLSLKAISNAVINIRQSKLPDPKQIGNAGSFFKNPLVSTEQYEKLKKQFPDLVAYPSKNAYKLAAGWLIEKAGWKGKVIDNRYGVHKQQALVLVNYSNTKGAEILQLAKDIQQSIKDMFAVELEMEVNII